MAKLMNKFKHLNSVLIFSTAALLLVNGCLDGTTSTASNDVPIEFKRLNGLYEGTPTYNGSGYTPLNIIQYYRFRNDGTFTWVGLQLLAPFKNELKDSIDSSILYFQYSDLKGKYAEYIDSLSFFGMESRESEPYGTYSTGKWAPLASYGSNKLKAFSSFSDTQFVTNVGGGGSNSNGSYTYYLTYKKIGDENASIPRKYLGP